MLTDRFITSPTQVANILSPWGNLLGYTLVFNEGKNQVVILVDHSFLNLKLKNFEP